MSLGGFWQFTGPALTGRLSTASWQFTV